MGAFTVVRALMVKGRQYLFPTRAVVVACLDGSLPGIPCSEKAILD
jgi:hypothetical protein